MAEGSHAGTVGKNPSHADQDFLVKIPFVRRWRHLYRDNRKACPADLIVKVRAILPQKL
jgi:hypothetical protein